MTTSVHRSQQRRQQQTIGVVGLTYLWMATLSGTRAFGWAAARRSGAAVTSSKTCASRLLSTATDDTAIASSTSNPLLQQDALPRFATIQPSDLTPAVSSLLTKLEDDFAKLEGELSEQTSSKNDDDSSNKEDDDTTVQLDFDSVLPKIEQMQFPIGYTWGIAGHLNGVKNGEELREAYEANQASIVKAFSKFSQSKPLYDALLAVESKLEQASSTSSKEDDNNDILQQQKRAVQISLRSMTLGGVGLEGAQKERFNDIKMRLASLSTTFGNNVLDETKAFSLTVTDGSQLAGVPASAKALWAASAAANGDDKATAEDGPWRITLDMPSYIAVLTHVPDRSVREQVYKASLTRASEVNEEKNNVPLIYEILTLKTELAQLLGFDNYAELSLASKMAPSIGAVSDLSELVREKALPGARVELQEITALAKEKGGDEYSDLEQLQPWDVSFWSERLKESKFDLTEEETRPYFALPAVLDGMFSLVERIFNIEVKAADGDTEVWNKDVRFFKVFDKESGKHISSFFLDPYSRPEDKRGGAWMDVCIGKSAAVNRDIPVAYLTCNGSPPVGDTTPSLMTFREVETLFHEFGHGLQHMLTTCSVGDVAGINGVEWDAVELPSQFMENWCYDKPTVYGFAKHWETGEPMPEEMFEKLKEQKTYNSAMMTCRQLLFGQLDIELHSNFDAAKGASGEGESIFDVQRRMAEKFTPYNMPLPEDRFLCTFSHIFAGGYAAGYYSYKWAEVMSADAFSAFEDVGLDNEEEVKRVGMKFRNTVLSLGGGEDPMTVFKNFRGREPNPDALLRHNGLA